MDRKIYRNAITTEDCNISEKVGMEKSVLLKDFSDPIINALLELIREDFNFTIKQESYIRIETRQNGHNWHIDRGTYDSKVEGHMTWCQLGISILLSDESEFTGGDTYYADMDFSHEENKIKSDRRQYDMCVHTSDVWHMVEPHEGSRTVLLMFI